MFHTTLKPPPSGSEFLHSCIIMVNKLETHLLLISQWKTPRPGVNVQSINTKWAEQTSHPCSKDGLIGSRVRMLVVNTTSQIQHRQQCLVVFQIILESWTSVHVAGIMVINIFVHRVLPHIFSIRVWTKSCLGTNILRRARVSTKACGGMSFEPIYENKSHSPSGCCCLVSEWSGRGFLQYLPIWSNRSPAGWFLAFHHVVQPMP